jgi:hypothetical protein
MLIGFIWRRRKVMGSRLRIPEKAENFWVTLVNVFEGGSPRKADNLTAICEPTVKRMWGPRYLTAL